MDFVRSPLFNLLEKSFISEIKMAGYSGFETLIVTKTDEVYGMGPLPDSSAYVDNLVLRPIPQLHKRNVERFVFGEGFIFILTQKGEVFSWGKNALGQLGLGHKTNMNEPTLISSLEGKEVIDIACGLTRVIALCSDQMFYYWGDYGGHGTISTPQSIGPKASGIACSPYASFYISHGEVYGIGFVMCNEGSTKKYSVGNGFVVTVGYGWEKIEKLSNIKKIVAGKSHIMALSNDDILFVWGSNRKKQLSIQICTEGQATPVKFIWISEKIVDIAANSRSDISVVITESSKIYVWGGCSGGNVLNPLMTTLTSIEEVFTHHSDPSMTYKGVTFQNEKRNKFFETGTLESIFDVKEDSDLTITVQGKPIYVHRAILKARCKYFLAMFTNEWKENNDKTLKIDGYSYDSYRSFLSYLYTGDIDVTLNTIFELVKIADKYSDEVLLDLIGEKLNDCSIPDEIVRILKDIMKLSSSNFEKFFGGIKMAVQNP